jgi:threonine/homoserine/homoserine lactone efflux protein
MTQHLALFLAASLLLAATPGPGLLYVAARTISGGRRDGLLSIAGTAAGGMVHVVAGSLGVSALLMASAQAFAILKIAGAIYLIGLGVRTFLAAGRTAPQSAPSGHRAFRDGVAVEAFNPKTAAFFLAFIPQFIEPSHPVALQFLVLGSISVCLNSLADVAVALAASRVRAGYLSRPGLARALDRISGSVLCGLGISLLFARRSS